MKITLKLITVFAVIALLSSCIKNNPKVVWVEIQPWVLQANPNLNYQEGVLSQDFSNAWVYIDNKVIGVFELPCKIPVLMDGTKEVIIFPTILKNGISDTKKIYPFMDSYKVNLQFNPGETIQINPVTKYNSIVKFWIEDFEDISIKLETDTESTAAIGIVTQDNGNRVGLVELDSIKKFWLGYSNSQMYIGQKGEAYLEIEYATDVQFLTGVLGLSSSGIKINPNLFLNPRKDSDGNLKWRKVYAELTEIVNYTAGDYFEQYIRAELPDNMKTAKIYIDNIKVVHY